MQDIFIEYMVKKRNTPQITLLRIVMVIVTIIIVFSFLALSTSLGEFSFLAVLMAFGSVYLAYRYISSFNIEYEYSVTNGDMDVDKIISQRKRKRLMTVKLREVEDFGRYKASEHEQKRYHTKIFACDSPRSEDLWFCTLNYREKGLTLLVFNASEKMLDGMKPFLPRPIMHRVFRIGG